MFSKLNKNKSRKGKQNSNAKGSSGWPSGWMISILPRRLYMLSQLNMNTKRRRKSCRKPKQQCRRRVWLAVWAGACGVCCCAVHAWPTWTTWRSAQAMHARRRHAWKLRCIFQPQVPIHSRCCTSHLPHSLVVLVILTSFINQLLVLLSVVCESYHHNNFFSLLGCLDCFDHHHLLDSLEFLFDSLGNTIFPYASGKEEDKHPCARLAWLKLTSIPTFVIGDSSSAEKTLWHPRPVILGVRGAVGGSGGHSRTHLCCVTVTDGQGSSNSLPDGPSPLTNLKISFLKHPGSFRKFT